MRAAIRNLAFLGAMLLGLTGTAQAREFAAGRALQRATTLAHADARLVLVSPAGDPVGGQWQSWVDGSHAPTIGGALILSVDQPGYVCGGAYGCSAGPGQDPAFPDALPAETWVYTGLNEWGFDWELGHQFDWAELTASQRLAFEILFRNVTTSWWDSLQGLEQGTEDGLEGEFAADYADCATDELIGYAGNGAYSIPPLTAAYMTRFCDLLDRIGSEDRAVMPRIPFSFAFYAGSIRTRIGRARGR